MSPLKATWTDGETVYARDHNNIARAVNLNSDAAVNLKLLLDGVANRPNATVAQALTAIRALGVTDADAVNALIAAAIQELQNAGNLGAGGGTVDTAAVNALISAALAAMIMPILDDHTTDIADLDTRLKSAQALVANLVNNIAEIVASDGEPLAQQLIDIIGGKPQGGGSIADVAATFAALGQALSGAVGIEEAAVNALIQAALAGLDLTGVGGGDLQPLLDLLAVKPGATVADVAEVWEALSNTSVGFAQLLATLSGKPLSQNPTVADVQAGLPVLIQTIVDQGVPGQIDAAIDASVTSGAIGSAISGLYSQLYNDDIVPLKTAVEQGFPYVQGELDKQGGRITALEAAALGSGDGVSQAVVDSLLERLDALEAENAKLKAQVLVLADNANTASAEVVDALAKKADKSALSATDLRVQSISDANTFLQDNLIALSGTVDDKADKTQLAAYAKLNDGNQEFTAGLIKVGGVQFTRSDEILAPVDYFDQKRLAVIPKGSQNLEDAGIVVVHHDLADFANGDVTSAQLSQAISTVQAPIEDLVRRTKNLTDDGTMSTLHVLGDGFRDENDNPTHPSLYEGLQFLIDALYSVADGSGQLSTGNNIVTMFEALTAAFSASGGGKDLGISVLQTTNGPVLSTAAGIIQTADQTAHGSREIIRIINVLNGVVNTVSGKVDTLWNRPGRISIAEADWQPCTITYGTTGVYAPPSGSIEAAEVDDVIYLRGGLSTNTFRTAITTGKFLEVAKLPAGMTRPLVAPLIPVWAILTGSSYRIAVIRIGTDGVIAVSGPTGAIDGFDATSSFPAGGIAARSTSQEDLSLLDAGGDGEQFDSVEDLEERLQLFMDAIDGPNATPEKMQETFWLINDVLSSLVEGAGMQITGRSMTPELAEGAPRQIFAQGIDPETPVPKSYLMGLVIGLTTTKLNKLLSMDLIPSFKQGSSIMIKPSDVAAAMETAGMYSEAEET